MSTLAMSRKSLQAHVHCASGAWLLLPCTGVRDVSLLAAIGSTFSHIDSEHVPPGSLMRPPEFSAPLRLSAHDIRRIIVG